MQIYTLADIVAPDSAVHPLSATSIKAKWVQVSVVSSTAGIRLGDLNVTSGRGAPVGTFGGQFFPQNTNEPNNTYDLGQICYVGTAGDVLTVIYAI